MKNRFTQLFISALGVSAVALLCQNAQSQGFTDYQDTASYSGANFNFDSGGAGSEEIGQEIVLGSSAAATVTGFSVQFDFTGTGTPTGTVDVGLYNNNGTAFNGYFAPGTEISDLGSTSLSSFTSGAGSTLNYTGLNIAVPNDFTYVVTFTGLTPTETAGLSIYGATTVGANYHDAWVNTGSGYVLQQAQSGFPALEFGATVTTVPEPGTIALGVMGACAFIARRRKS
jgi:hypothetical protein